MLVADDFFKGKKAEDVCLVTQPSWILFPLLFVSWTMADDVDKTNTPETTQQQQIVLIGEPDSTNPNIRKYKNLTYDITDPKYQGLSKNALKRILKEEYWNATRDERNKRQKEKHKQKHAERRKLIEEGVIPAPPPKRPRVVNPSNVKVAIDCSFSSYMTEKVYSNMEEIVH